MAKNGKIQTFSTVRKSLNTHGTLSVYLLCRLLTVNCFQKNRFGEIVNSGSQSNSKVQSTLSGKSMIASNGWRFLIRIVQIFSFDFLFFDVSDTGFMSFTLTLLGPVSSKVLRRIFIVNNSYFPLLYIRTTKSVWWSWPLVCHSLRETYRKPRSKCYLRHFRISSIYRLFYWP